MSSFDGPIQPIAKQLTPIEQKVMEDFMENSAPTALTREQVDNIELFVKSEGERAVRILCSDVLMLTASHEAQRLTITQLEQERDEAQARCVSLETALFQSDVVKLRETIAQLQARCWELEKEIGSPNETCSYAWDRKERIRMKRVIDDFCIAEGKLQATLAEREARIVELEELVTDETESHNTFMYNISKRIAALTKERDAAVAEAGRLREALAALHAVQNGSPLPSYDKDWNTAMQLTERALNEHHASGGGGGSANRGAQS